MDPNKRSDHSPGYCPDAAKFPAKDWVGHESEEERSRQSFLIKAYQWLMAHTEYGMWCTYNEIAAELLEWMESHDPLSVDLRARSDKDILACTTCITQYYQAKQDFLESKSLKYTQESLTTFMTNLHTFDQQRVLKVLQILGTDEKAAKQLSLVTLEILLSPELLENRDIFRLFSSRLKAQLATTSLELPHRFRGLYLLMFHTDAEIRQWALDEAVRFGPARSSAESQPLEDILTLVQKWITRPTGEMKLLRPDQKEFWSSVQVLLDLFAKIDDDQDLLAEYARKTPSFADSLHQELTRRRQFDDWLGIFFALLQRFGYQFWYLTTMPYMAIFDTIERTFTLTYEESIQLDCCDMVGVLVESLSDQLSGGDEHEKLLNTALIFLGQHNKGQRSVSAEVYLESRAVIAQILISRYAANPPRPPMTVEHIWAPAILFLLRSKSPLPDIVSSEKVVALVKTILSTDTDELANAWKEETSASEKHYWTQQFWSSLSERPRDMPAVLLTTFVESLATLALVDIAVLNSNTKNRASLATAVDQMRVSAVACIKEWSDADIRGVEATVMSDSIFMLLSSPDERVRRWATTLVKKFSDCDKVDDCFSVFLNNADTVFPMIQGISSTIETMESIGWTKCYGSWGHFCFWLEKVVKSYPAQLLEACQSLNKIVEAASSVEETAASNPSSPLFTSIISLFRHVLTNGMNVQCHVQTNFVITSVRFFQLFAAIVTAYYNEYPIDTLLKQHSKWVKSFFQWARTGTELQRRWVSSLIAVVQGIRNLRMEVSSVFVDACSKAFSTGVVALDKDQLEQLTRLLPGVSLQQVKPELANLPSAKKQESSQVLLLRAKPAVKLPSFDDDVMEIDAEEYAAPPRLRAVQGKIVIDVEKLTQKFKADPTSISSFEASRRARMQSNKDVLKFHTYGSDGLLLHLANARKSSTSPPNSPTKRKLPASFNSRPAPNRSREKLKQQLGIEGGWSGGSERRKPGADLERQKAMNDEKRRLELQRQKEDRHAAGNKAKTALILDSGVKQHILERKKLEERVARRNRMAPSVDDLYKLVLVWDYYNPRLGKVLSNTQEAVPQKFDNLEHYMSVFEPLLIEEFRASVEESLIEQSTEDAKVMTVLEFQKVNAFYFVTFGRKNHDFRPDDLVLLETKPPPSGATPGKPPLSGVYIFGKVDKVEKESRTKFPHKTHVRVRFYLDFSNNRVAKTRDALLSLNKEFTLRRVVNMVTMLREYQSLQAMKNFPLSKVILNPEQSSEVPFQSTTSDLLDRFDSESRTSSASRRLFNPAQVDAIRNAVAKPGFTLIQGPPGTGKSHTIIGLVSVLLEKNHGPLLICAHSNAATDEIASRLTRGVYTTKAALPKLPVADSEYLPEGVFKTPADIVRVGQGPRDYDMRPEVKAITLNQRINTNVQAKQSQRARDAAIQMTKDGGKSSVNSSTLSTGPISLTTLEHIQAKHTQKHAILNAAQIVCTTLTTSGQNLFTKLKRDFATVIIDEAAQAVELSILIAMRYGCQRCILVGDPQQLPATVKSHLAKQFQYEQSLFARMVSNKFPCSVLTVQYRMHKLIRAFPSKHFYEDKLTDGPQNRTRSWHTVPVFGPVCFFDIATGQASSSYRGSLSNANEADFVCKLFQNLSEQFGVGVPDFDKTVGVISPYKSQVALIQSRMRAVPNSSKVEISTVDAYQGREKDVIIVSTVRASSGKGVGFLSDIRRMNVALTRAKCSLWVVGNAQALIENQHWKALIDYTRDFGCYFPVNNVDGFFRWAAKPVQSPSPLRRISSNPSLGGSGSFAKAADEVLIDDGPAEAQQPDPASPTKPSAATSSIGTIKQPTKERKAPMTTQMLPDVFTQKPTPKPASSAATSHPSLRNSNNSPTKPSSPSTSDTAMAQIAKRPAADEPSFAPPPKRAKIEENKPPLGTSQLPTSFAMPPKPAPPPAAAKKKPPPPTNLLDSLMSEMSKSK